MNVVVVAKSKELCLQVDEILLAKESRLRIHHDLDVRAGIRRACTLENLAFFVILESLESDREALGHLTYLMPDLSIAYVQFEEAQACSVSDMGPKGLICRGLEAFEDKCSQLFLGQEERESDELDEVLIVDDEEVICQLLSRYLINERVTVHCAENGYHALSIARNSKIRYAFVDVNMPHMNGIEAVVHLKHHNPNIRVVLMSADDKTLIAEKLKGVFVEAHLQKPFSKSLVLKTFRDIRLQVQTQAAVRHLGEDHRLDEKWGEFYKFLPRTFLKDGTPQGIRRGLSHVEDCSVLFIDIRKFSTISQGMKPDECFRFLNSYFEIVEPIVLKFGGMAYQFLGDGIVCIFPLQKGRFTNNVLHAAVSIQDHILIYNRGRERAGYPPIEIGCGIDAGPVSFGICGSKNRYEVGAFSNTVTIAARCDSICSMVSAKIIMTQDVVDRLDGVDMMFIRYLGDHKLKGISEKKGLYEVFINDSQALKKIKVSHQNVIAHAELNDSEALRSLEDPVLSKLPEVFQYGKS